MMGQKDGLTVPPEFERERSTSSIDSAELRDFLRGGQMRQLDQLLAMLDKSPVLKNSSRLQYLQLGPKDRFEFQCRIFREFGQLLKRGEFRDFQTANQFNEIIGSPLTLLHFGMVIPAIQKLATEEQVEYWLPKMMNLEVIFTYVQTELGHGTWLSKLETTATFDKATRQFVLDSNTNTGYKFWPGHLGKSVTHAMLMAQLVIDGVCHGPHLFLVQVRDLNTFRPLPGVDIGDIGPTEGFMERDNGFLGLRGVRIPMKQMLMKYQVVTPEGQYSSLASPKVQFAAMLKIRTEIVPFSGLLIAAGATIATRYSILRRQCELRPGEGEWPVIDYLTQQDKLFPAICAMIAHQAAHRSLLRHVDNASVALESGRVDELNTLHCLLAGLKALTSAAALKHSLVLRGACGGHGFSLASGLPPIVTEADAMCTYEGDNIVMHQVCARNLAKTFAAFHMGGELQEGEVVSYLCAPEKASAEISCCEDLMNCVLLVHLYERRSRWALERGCLELQSHISRRGLSKEDAWVSSSVSMVQASMAHCQLFVVRSFLDTLNNYGFSPPLRSVMEKVCVLYALLGMRESLADFIMAGCLSRQSAAFVHDAIIALYGQLRPHILTLAEGFDFPDCLLNSCIGSSEGKPYEKLLQWAKSSQTNDPAFIQDMFHKYIKPVLQTPSKL